MEQMGIFKYQVLHNAQFFFGVCIRFGYQQHNICVFIEHFDGKDIVICYSVIGQEIE